jgi:hypothetical protein
MTRTRSRIPAASPASLWTSWLQAWEISVAAPQVAATRMARMATGGWPPSAADTREMTRMVQEKGETFAEAWTGAMFAWQRGAGAMLGQGLKPVHRTVTANRRRLAKPRR